ncbi:MAG: hypothetical protein ACOYI8_05480 [Christensenellales bacterium]|jgi:hypothetical protein
MLKDLVGAFIYAPMLTVLVLGLPLVAVMLINGGKLFNRRKVVKKQRTRKKMARLGAAHLFFGVLPILLTFVSMIQSINMYVCVFGAIMLALSSIALGIFARKFRASHALGIAQIALGILFALLLAAFWWFVTFKLHMRFF